MTVVRVTPGSFRCRRARRRPRRDVQARGSTSDACPSRGPRSCRGASWHEPRRRRPVTVDAHASAPAGRRWSEPRRTGGAREACRTLSCLRDSRDDRGRSQARGRAGGRCPPSRWRCRAGIATARESGSGLVPTRARGCRSAVYETRSRPRTSNWTCAVYGPRPRRCVCPSRLPRCPPAGIRRRGTPSSAASPPTSPRTASGARHFAPTRRPRPLIGRSRRR